MTPEELAAIEARAKAATEGPWTVYAEALKGTDDERRAHARDELGEQVDETHPLAPALYMLNAGGKCPALTGCGPTSEANATFIAHARTDVPTLLAAYRAKEAECARLREALRDARDMVADWASYASEYYQKKWRLDEDLAKIDAALEAKP